MSNSSQQRVAIIGAGVSGLVAAVNMFKVGIKPTIFEKASGVGGLWNTDVAPCWDSLRTNTSKFWTVLPDFAWPVDTYMFPTQREVSSYLSKYAQQSLPSDIFLFNTNVTNISRTNDGTNLWTVHYCTKNDKSTSNQYDFVIVASGLYTRPEIPRNIAGLSSFSGKILHSADYRSPEQVCGKRVIIVGSSISAAKIADDMALKADHIIHIVPHKVWHLPRFAPMISNDSGSPFLPLDSIFYRRSTRVTNSEQIFRDVNDYQKFNEYCRLVVGGDQLFSYSSDSSDDPLIYIAVSDMYLGWYREGRISLQYGRLSKVNENGTLTLDNETMIDTTSDDVLVLCTGFRTCLDFFSSDILEQLSYKPDDIFSPLILYREILPSNLPGLAFIGMFGGPHWTIIHLQARWIAALFSGALPMPSISEQQIGIDTQHRIRNQRPRPQFPHFDPVGAANDLAKDLGLIPSNITDSVLAAHYRIGGPDPAVIAEYNTIVDAASHGRFVAGVVFRAFHGSKWTYERTLTGQSIAGMTRGKAQFKLSDQYQLLYSEESELTVLPSMTTTTELLRTTQCYMYVYDDNKDSLTVYFVENDILRGSFVHTIQIEPKKSKEQVGWTAIGDHQYNDDHYSVSYLFVFTGVQLARFEITYVVNGPNKDYVSTTRFHPEHGTILE